MSKYTQKIKIIIFLFTSLAGFYGVMYGNFTPYHSTIIFGLIITSIIMCTIIFYFSDHSPHVNAINTNTSKKKYHQITSYLATFMILSLNFIFTLPCIYTIFLGKERHENIIGTLSILNYKDNLSYRTHTQYSLPNLSSTQLNIDNSFKFQKLVFKLTTKKSVFGTHVQSIDSIQKLQKLRS